MDEDDPEGAVVAEKIAATPRKRTREEALPEEYGQNDENLDNFTFSMAHDGSGSAAVLELQEMVQWLGTQVKAVPVIQTFKDICRLDSNVAALTNK